MGASIAAGAGGSQAPKLFGKGRKTADFFRENFQDPFGKRVASIIDPLNEAKKAGTLTKADATTAQTALEAEIADFTKNASEFEALGNEQKTVVGQARNTLTPIIRDWRSSLTSTIAGLPDPKPEERILLTPPTLDTVTGKEGTTPLLKAQGAAEQQRKRALAGYGRQSTILTGGGLPAYSGKGKSLLGY